jgi:hypothetical protein
MNINLYKDLLIKTCRKNNVQKLCLFGSMARGEATQNSDIDLLIKFSKRKSLLDMILLENELTEKIGRKIDLLTESAISPYLKDRINNELVVIYEEK